MPPDLPLPEGTYANQRLEDSYGYKRGHLRGAGDARHVHPVRPGRVADRRAGPSAAATASPARSRTSSPSRRRSGAFKAQSVYCSPGYSRDDPHLRRGLLGSGDQPEHPERLAAARARAPTPTRWAASGVGPQQAHREQQRQRRPRPPAAIPNPPSAFGRARDQDRRRGAAYRRTRSGARGRSGRAADIGVEQAQPRRPPHRAHRRGEHRPPVRGQPRLRARRSTSPAPSGGATRRRPRGPPARRGSPVRAATRSVAVPGQPHLVRRRRRPPRGAGLNATPGPRAVRRVRPPREVVECHGGSRRRPEHSNGASTCLGPRRRLAGGRHRPGDRRGGPGPAAPPAPEVGARSRRAARPPDGSHVGVGDPGGIGGDVLQVQGRDHGPLRAARPPEGTRRRR